MAECIKCEVSDEKALLFDVISKEGIVKICRKCNLEENLPLVHQVKKQEGIEREMNVYNRLAKYAGLDPREHRGKFEHGALKEDPMKKQDKSLKEIVDSNYKKKLPKEKPRRDDLIYNFHWIIMRERRRRKLTQSQLAQELQESEQAIRMIEQGYVPEEGGNKLILKLENFLKINLSIVPVVVSDETRYREIDPTKLQIEREFKEDGTFDKLTTKHLTISDLKRIRQEQSQGVSKSVLSTSDTEDFLDPFSDNGNKKKKWWQKKEKTSEEVDLSSEEIEKIIYGDE